MIRGLELIISAVVWYIIISNLEQRQIEKRPGAKALIKNGPQAMISRLFFRPDISIALILIATIFPLALIVLHGRDIAASLAENRTNVSLGLMMIAADYDIYLSQLFKKPDFKLLSSTIISNIIMIVTLICVSNEYGIIDIYTLTQQQANFAWGIMTQPLLAILFLGTVIKKLDLTRENIHDYKIASIASTIKKITYGYLMVALFFGASDNIFPILVFQEKHAGILPFFEWFSLSVKVVLMSMLFSFVERRYLFLRTQTTQHLVKIFLTTLLVVFIVRVGGHLIW